MPNTKFTEEEVGNLGQLCCGDCLDVMKSMPSNSVSSIVTDPPAGIAFMGKKWDSDKGGRDQWIDWLTTVMKECLRVIKPGGMMLVWSIPRTSHWTATAIENAGFEIRDKIYHLFGSGFPKSSNISKHLDRKLGKERKVVGKREHPTLKDKSKVNRQESTQYHGNNTTSDEWDLTEPASDEAKLFDGYGTATKPAVEEWILAMAPIESTFAENALKHGVAGLNIDGSRIEYKSEVDLAQQLDNFKGHGSPKSHNAKSVFTNIKDHLENKVNKQGRWPANLILSHHPECVRIGTKKVGQGFAKEGSGSGGIWAKSTGKPAGQVYGNETIEEYQCHPDCPIHLLNQQSGVTKSGLLKAGHPYGLGNGQNVYGTLTGHTQSDTHADQGYASRFFLNLPPDTTRFCYSAKASKSERNRGCENLEEKECNSYSGAESRVGKVRSDGATQHAVNTKKQNNHPTVKPLKLLKYLCNLIASPTKGIILDPFGGSGTTGVACEQLKIPYILIEKESDYCAIIKARVKAANDPEPIRKTKKAPKQTNTLFDWNDLDLEIN